MDWSKEWPTEPGYYWFYGKLWSMKPALHLVRAFKTSNSIAYTTEGYFVYEGEAMGVWAKAQLPEPPTEDMTSEQTD